MELKFDYVITLFILPVNEWFCNATTINLNEVDPLYQKKVWKYQHHAENYMESLAQVIALYRLQLKKKAAISSI